MVGELISRFTGRLLKVFCENCCRAGEIALPSKGGLDELKGRGLWLLLNVRFSVGLYDEGLKRFGGKRSKLFPLLLEKWFPVPCGWEKLLLRCGVVD